MTQNDLQSNLRGVDLVISTVSGTAQINLIDAAAASHVRRFAPAEFEGPSSRRPVQDPLDRGRAACLDRLRHWSRQRHAMHSTVFTCGVFYEHFAIGGLAAMGIGNSTSVAYQGSFLMDIGAGTAEIVEHTANERRPVVISMTSVYDVARFLAAALDISLRNWPSEFRMYGDRRSVGEILQWAETTRGHAFQHKS